MKTLNYKLLSLILLITFFQGCLPDSLTKFKQDAPKAAAKTAPGVTVTDSSGNKIDSSTITYPTYFRFRDSTNTTISNWYMKVNTSYGDTNSNVHVDGSLSNASLWTSLYSKCEIDVDSTDGTTDNDVLPDGLYLNQSNCKIYGIPTTIYTSTNPATIGLPIAYKVRLYFKNAKGTLGTSGNVTCSSTECYILSDSFNLGVYKTPEDLKLTQNDKIGLELSGFVTDIKVFTSDDGDITTRTDVITSKTFSMASTQIIDSKKNITYILRAIPLTLSCPATNPTCNPTDGFIVGGFAGTYDVITVANSASFNVGDAVTTNSPGNYSGVVSSKFGTNSLRILRDENSGASLGSQLNGVNISSSTLVANPIYGQILSVNSSTNVVRITQSPLYSGTFGIASNITPYGQNYNVDVSNIDIGDSITENNEIDNDLQFYSTEARVVGTTQYYAVGSAITPIKPNIGTNDKLYPSNGITYTIYPALPTGLTFCQTTATLGCAVYGAGYIIGTFNSELEPTEFTVTATNPIGSTTYRFKLAAIYKPTYLSYTQNQIIRAFNASTNPTSVFYEGDNIYGIKPSINEESIKATIKRKFKDTNFTSVETFLELFNHNGIFKLGDSIDSGRSFIAEKAFISSTSKIYNYNLVLYVASTTNFNVGDIVSNSATVGLTTPVAYARIIYKNASRNVLYLQFLTPNLNSIGTFYQNNTIVDTTTAATTTISQIESSKYKLALSNFVTNQAADGFTTGNDIVSTDSSTQVSGYIYDYDDDLAQSYILVDNTTRTPSVTNSGNIILTHYPEFMVGQHIIANEKYPTLGSTVTISNVTFDNFFTATRGESFFMNPNLAQGSNLSFTIDTDLPAGLTLDPATGIVSGRATYLTPRKVYTITASNLLGKSQFQFELEVKDYFKIAEESSSTSYVLHKYGDTQNIRDCKISATDILNSTGNLDIRCFLDAEEQDLYQIGLKFRSLVGPGVCEFVQYTPFSFQQKPGRTMTDDDINGSFTVNYVNGCSQNTDLTYPNFLPGTCSDPTFTTKQSCLNDNGLDTFPNTADDPTWTDNFVTKAPDASSTLYCPANYNSLDAEEPNCDEDTFSIRTITTAINSSTGKCEVSTDVPSLVKCGGDRDSCIVGAIKDIFSAEEIQSGYRSKIYEASSGLNSSGGTLAPTFTHRGGLDRNLYSNLSLSNGILLNNTTASNTDQNAWSSYIGSKTYTSKRGATKVLRDTALANNPFVNGSPEYVFNCLDAAYDIKARIRVVVRDWDRAYKINDNIDQENPGTCSNRTYRTSATCTGASETWTTRMNNSANNAYEDWDNDYSGNGLANYATGTCSLGVPYNNHFVDCIVNGGTWTPTAQFQFPGGWL